MRKHFFVAMWLAALVCGNGAAVHAQIQPAAKPKHVWVLMEDNRLVQVSSQRPSVVTKALAVSGLADRESLVGIDFRVARGVLYGVTTGGRVVTLSTTDGSVRYIGQSEPWYLGDGPFGVDFNPAADRIRLVSAQGLNARLHPDTGAVVDFDPKVEGMQRDPDLHYDSADVRAGQMPRLLAAAYTYNPRDDKKTTNYALDAAGTLVRQGSHEDDPMVVSPNLGRLYTVGALGIGALIDASFDIADVDNVALAAVRTTEVSQTRLVYIDLSTGKAHVIGQLVDGRPVRGIAIEP